MNFLLEYFDLLFNYAESTTSIENYRVVSLMLFSFIISCSFIVISPIILRQGKIVLARILAIVGLLMYSFSIFAMPEQMHGVTYCIVFYLFYNIRRFWKFIIFGERT